MNFDFYGSNETCVLQPEGEVQPTQQLRNVRVNDRYDVSLFATLRLRVDSDLSCTDHAGRSVSLTAVALR